MKNLSFLYGKKLLVILLIAFVLLFAGCNKEPGKDPNKPTPDDAIPNMQGEDFVIMVNKASSTDPRKETYTGNFKEEKIAKIAEVEKKYNVNVVYKTYPASAVWGGGRETFINFNSKNKTPQAHIYEMPSYSTAVLAEAKSILSLDAFVEKYGNPGYWPEKKAFDSVLDTQYSYDAEYPIATEGLFYNIDLLEELLGEGRGTEPSQLWKENKWDWAAFEKMAHELLPGIVAKKVENSGVLGGQSYNWLYQLLGANGISVVTTDLKSQLASTEAIETMTFLHNLIKIPGMWEHNVPLSNASAPQFKAGYIAFHNGETHWIYDETKWLGSKFRMGFVPYPTGPNTKSDLSNYFVSGVYGKTSYVVSSSYAIENIEPEYKNFKYHGETIFRIWADMQYFPEIDETTGFVSIDPYVDQWKYKTLDIYYSNAGGGVSVDAHKSVMKKLAPDYFYSLYWARSQDYNKSFMLEIRDAIVTGTARERMTDLVAKIHQEFLDTYSNLGLTADHYN